MNAYAALAILVLLILSSSLLLQVRRLQARLRAAGEDLASLASTDALTGLLNRRAILRRLEEEMDRHQRGGEPLGCLLMDVDHFKAVNDRHGHGAGDEVLRQVARQLREVLRPYDVVGRFGGDLFLVILPGSDHETTRKVAERLRARLPEQVRAGEGGEGEATPLTASLGFTIYRPGEGAEAFVGRADRGMYVAKGLGRNRVEEDAF